MNVIAVMFRGPCGVCGRPSERARNGISLDVTSDGLSGEHLCLTCARRLKARLELTIAICVSKRAKGLVYRHGTWRRPEAP